MRGPAVRRLEHLQWISPHGWNPLQVPRPATTRLHALDQRRAATVPTMTARRLFAGLVAASLAVAACSGDDDDSSASTEPVGTTTVPSSTTVARPAATTTTTATTTTAPATTTTTVAPSPATYEAVASCPMEIPATVTIEIECGYLTVPENRDDPNSNDVRLAVAHLHSPAVDARPDPVVELSGGPGFPSLENIGNWANSPILERRDLVLFDQRGLGFSEPNLDCPETNEAAVQIFTTNDSGVAEGEVMRTSTEACRLRLVAAGVDLGGYDTMQSAADVADLRVALGIEQWNLRGVSYGSALAQAVVRYHPEGIRSVLLDSVVPLDAGLGGVARGESALRAFNALYAACAASATCASTYGDVEALFAEAAASLDVDPHEVTIPDPVSGAPRQVSIDGGDLYAGLFNAMYDEALIPALPGAARAIADGDRSIIDALAPGGIAFLADQYEAMTFSVQCADTGRLYDAATVEPFLAAHPELDELVHIGLSEVICPTWGVEPNPEDFNQLLTADETDVPIIVLAGAFDPITPPDGSRRVAAALGLDLIVLPNGGHGAVGIDCGRSIWFAFLEDPATTPDTSCVAALAPPFS